MSAATAGCTVADYIVALADCAVAGHTVAPADSTVLPGCSAADMAAATSAPAGYTVADHIAASADFPAMSVHIVTYSVHPCCHLPPM